MKQLPPRKATSHQPDRAFRGRLTLRMALVESLWVQLNPRQNFRPNVVTVDGFGTASLQRVELAYRV